MGTSTPLNHRNRLCKTAATYAYCPHSVHRVVLPCVLYLVCCTAEYTHVLLTDTTTTTVVLSGVDAAGFEFHLAEKQRVLPVELYLI